MKCYYHPDADAVGICKSCSKGVCKECAAEVGNGIACREKCEEEVRVLNELIERNKKVLRKTYSAYKRATVIYVLIGIVFLTAGIMEKEILPIKYFMSAAGAVMFIGGILTYISGRSFNKK